MKMQEQFQALQAAEPPEPATTPAEPIFKRVKPNIVQSIRAFHVEELQQTAQQLGQHFLYVNLSGLTNKQEVLETIGSAFLFPPHYGRNFDALYDCITEPLHKCGTQPGFVVVVEKIPETSKFDREARELLLDVFRDAADYWAERSIPFRCFYSFQ